MSGTLEFDPGAAQGNVDALQFKIASSRAEREGAFRLLYRAYLRSGLGQPNPSHLRITPYHLLPTTEVFVAMLRDEVATTVSLVLDSDDGLPMESMYADEIAKRRAANLRIAEVTCLADRRREFRRFLPSFGRLTRLMAQYARRQGVDQLLAVVHPRHARFYEYNLGFDRFGSLTQCPHVQNSPAVALCLDFRQAEQNRPPCYDHFFGERLPEQQLQPQPIPSDDRAYFARYVDAAFRIAS